VVGNEMADKLAVGVAKGTKADNLSTVMGAGWTGLPDSNDRHATLWPYYQAPHHPAPAPHIPIPNMGEELRRATNHKLHLGWSNQTPTYWRGWANQLKNMHPISFAYMTRPSLVPWAARRAALLYRTGTLYTGKAAHWFKHRPNNLCMAGCGQPDGIHHAVSACPLMHAHRTKRHNTAARILATALQHNTAELKLHSADVGSTDDCAAAGLTHNLPRNIGPQWLPAVGISDADRARLAALKPDIVLVKGCRRRKRDTATPPPREIHLIEVKYGRDAWPEQQEENAQQQYAELTQALRARPAQQVHLHSVVLGVGGTIYKDTATLLKDELGVPQKVLTSTLQQLHVHAVNTLHHNIQARRAIEHGPGGLGKQRRRTPSGVT
jgi:hypothetical protein